MSDLLTRAQVFQALRTAGITEVKVGYRGGGDEGDIEDYSWVPDLDLPEWDEIEEYIREEILNSSYLENWTDNEGGFGEVTMTVASETIHVEHNVCYVDAFQYQEEF